MYWLAQNWFWLLIALLFVGMHLGHGGHGGHGSHGRQPRRGDDDPGQTPETDAPRRRTGHQH